jgi:serine/threonine protein kinase/Tfp pilus assembly protein PilF
MAHTYKAGSIIADQWEVHSVLEGGMGVVYVVYDHKLHEASALKTYRDEVFETAPETADRFRQEALTWITLDIHPNITQARLVTNIDNKPYVVMEFVSGGDLASRIAGGDLIEDPILVLRFALQFCDGMMHAVAKGVKAHRDIKPQNCLIADGGILKVTDFGLAKVLSPSGKPSVAAAAIKDSAWSALSGTHSFLNLSQSPECWSPGLTRTGVGAGTCTHMAPEQFKDAKRVDIRADVYSFGVMLFQMLTGYLPFQGRTWQDFKRLHETKVPPILSGPLADSLNPVIQRCLHKDPGKRFSDFSVLRDELADIFSLVAGRIAPKPVAGPKLQAFQLSAKAVSLCNLGRTQQGLACFDEALDIDPFSVAIWYNKGVYLGKTRAASACYQRALENLEYAGELDWTIDPELIWFNMGVALEDLGDSQSAANCYERALSVNPHYEKALLAKGSWLESSGRIDDALALYDMALAANPRSVGALVSKGSLVADLGCLDEGLHLMSAALEIDPRCLIGLYNKGLILGKLGRSEEEITCYDAALKIDPKYGMCWYNKGIALGELGRIQEELTCYQRAIDIDPNHWQAWMNKGTTLVQLHSFTEALTCFEAAKRLGSEEAGEALQRCHRLIELQRR